MLHDCWIRPTSLDAPLVWGRTDGVVFGLPSEGGMPGPRGLIRIGVWNRETERAELINFVAVEPVTEGAGPRHSRMAFSELEPSQYDAPHRGKRLWIPEYEDVSGEWDTIPQTPEHPSAFERLTVRIEVERFTANGAHVYVTAQMRSDEPNEVALTVHHHADSPPIAEHTLTATMGNYERLRLLWLKNRVVESRAFYAGYDGTGFAEKEEFPSDEIYRTDRRDALVLCSSDEPNPSAVDAGHPWWTYKSRRLTQYWRIPAADIQPDVRIRVNGRRVYWGGDLVIPGGISFENFEVRQRYVPGQRFIFGLSDKEPWEIEPGIGPAHR